VGLPRVGRPVHGHFVDRAMWPVDLPDDDVHVGFRADLELVESAELTIRIQAAASFRLWVDGELAVAGPLRYAPAAPEFHTQHVRLGSGRHALAVQANGGGLLGRMVAGLPSFLWVVVIDGSGRELPLTWLARRFPEYTATGLRTSPLLDWLEWCDDPLDPGWRVAEPSAGWAPPRSVDGLHDVLGPATPGVIDLPSWPTVIPAETGRGTFRESFTGYRFDDPSVQFILADRAPGTGQDVDGSWFRYDLGRIRIGSLELTVDTGQPAEVTIGYADRLDPHGQVAPVVALSTGPTRMIQHYAVAPGRTRIEPFGAMGARYVEVRVTSPAAVEVTEVTFRDRDFLGDPRGSFRCDDPVLDRIWDVGLTTLRACAEDALIDSIRERGEWVGDVMASAVDLLAVGWGDQRLVHRALLHAAASPRDDGLVAGCVPGEPIFVGTYAAQWLNVCVQVAEHDADLGVLMELETAGRANVEALLALVAEDGSNTLPWSFVDWGHAVPDGRPDVATLLHVLRGLNAWIRWQELLSRAPDEHVERRRTGLADLIARLIATGQIELDQHTATLGYLAGLVEVDVAAPVVRRHLLGGFPFDPTAPRLRDPGRVDPSVVTPYFTNYSMQVLLDAGETDLVLDLWRRGWGWMLDQGATTWWEVFDDRWSQCHFWSGAPTWQLTRYLLGVRVTSRDGSRVLDIAVTPGSLRRCRGAVPTGPRQVVEVAWHRRGDTLDFHLSTEHPQMIMTAIGPTVLQPGRHRLMLERDDRGTHRPASTVALD